MTNCLVGGQTIKILKNMVFRGQIGKIEDFRDTIVNWRTSFEFEDTYALWRHYNKLQSTLKKMSLQHYYKAH